MKRQINYNPLKITNYMLSDSTFVGHYIFDGSFVQGLIVEMIGSFLFIIFLLYALRPKFAISPVIIKYVDRNTGQMKYSVKVINQSIFAAIDVEVHLSYYSLVPAANARPHKDNKTLSLLKNTYSYVPNRFNKDNEFALWFSTGEILENFMNPPTQPGVQQVTNTVLFRVIMRHSLTGLTTAKEQEYTAIGQIIENHYFKSGHTFDTVRV